MLFHFSGLLLTLCLLEFCRITKGVLQHIEKDYPANITLTVYVTFEDPLFCKSSEIGTLVESLSVANIEKIKHCFTGDKLDPTKENVKTRTKFSLDDLTMTKMPIITGMTRISMKVKIGNQPIMIRANKEIKIYTIKHN